MLASFQQVNQRHEELFETDIVKGIKLVRNYRKNEALSSTINACFYQHSMFFKDIGGGHVQIAQSPARHLDCFFEFDKSDFSLIGQISENPYIIATLKPSMRLKASLQLFYTSSKLFSTASTILCGTHYHMVFKAKASDFKKFEDMEFRAHFGYPESGFGIQLVSLDTRLDNVQYAVMVHGKLGKSMVQSAFVLNQLPTFVFRSQRQITQNWSAGTYFSVDSMLRSNASFAWKAFFGQTTIKSKINIHGIIETQFRRRVSPQFSVDISGKMDYRTHQYIFGSQLSWSD